MKTNETHSTELNDNDKKVLKRYSHPGSKTQQEGTAEKVIPTSVRSSYYK